MVIPYSMRSRDDILVNNFPEISVNPIVSFSCK
jgi:hypothetical protein